MGSNLTANLASQLTAKWCGLTRYSVGLELQDCSVQKVQRSESYAELLGLEHEPVITLGRKSSAEEDVIHAPQGFEVCRTSRGGKATLHEPGQLVIYPIANILKVSVGVKDFVQKSLEALSLTVREFGIQSRVDLQDPGVFTPDGKIGFIGLQVTHGITRHGLSLNVSNPVDHFKSIRPCGHHQQKMDSFLLNGVDATPKDVFQVFTQHWFHQFGLTKSQNTANPDRPCLVAWRSW